MGGGALPFSSGTFGGIFLGEMGSVFFFFFFVGKFFYFKKWKKTENFLILGIFWDHISK